MQELIDQLNGFLTGPIMVAAILLVGVVLSVKTGFVQLRKLPYTLKQTAKSLFSRKKHNGITPFQAVTTALAGTIGTGNIVGVATAITIGGAGAVFWLWVSAFFGMATKYSEIVLAVKYRQTRPDGSYFGGPMYYLRHAVSGKWLSIAFAIAGCLSSFGIGSMVQSNAIGGAVFELSPSLCIPVVAVVTIACGLVIIGGIKRIARVTEAFIPFMALFYLAGCFIIIFKQLPALLGVFSEIFSEAFGFRSAVGGVSGYAVLSCMKVGFARGIFTNEAGLGSAPIAHAAADAKSPAQQGLLGVFEVFFDTIIMCTLTAIVILLSGLHHDKSLSGAALTLGAFELELSSLASGFIAISTVFFATAAIISWGYYGQVCAEYLFKTKTAVLIYKLIYICSIYMGARVTLSLVWGVADALNGLMLIPNLIGLVLLCNTVKCETKKEFSHGLTDKP